MNQPEPNVSLSVVETADGFRCAIPNCPVSERWYRKLAGLSSHQSFVHHVRSDRPYRKTSTRRGLDRKAGELDAGRLRVLAAIPRMHAPPLERIIPDIREPEPLPVDRGDMQHIRKRVEWMILDLARELRQPAANVRIAFSLVADPRPKAPAPRLFAASLGALNDRGAR